MSHCRERREAQRAHIEQFRKAEKAAAEPKGGGLDVCPPTLYRADLFRKMKNTRIGSNVSQLGDIEIANDCKLSVGTVRAALAGSAVRVDTLWKLSRYFGIPWFLVWDIDKHLTFELLEDGTGIRCKYEMPDLAPAKWWAK